MLDPAFGYDPDTRVGQNPGEETLILQRYRVLWSLSVDSRLSAAGREPMLSKEDRFKEFRSWYRKIPPPQLKSVFEGLWQMSYFTHSELIEMSTDTLRVMDRAADAGFALLLLDVDRFKLFNEAHGPSVGDAVLRDRKSVV